MGEPVHKSLHSSALLRALSGGNRLMLTECKRSGAELFDFYASLVEEPRGSRFERSLRLNVQEARSIFTEDGATGFLAETRLAPTNLVISHRLREHINAECNEADRQGREAQQFTMKEFGMERTPNANGPQDAWFWPGQRVLACSRGRKLRNGREYEIVGLSARVVLRETSQPTQDLTLSRAEFFRAMRLPYAVTYASAQGLTIEGLLALHDVDHMHFSWRHLYVGMSRARGREKLIVHSR
jgi:hypothetical protein